MTRTRTALDAQGMSDEELAKMASFLSSQVDTMDDESVAYGAYAASAVPGERQAILGTLPARLMLSYRSRLVAWFEYALKKRAKAGGGGSGIKRIEQGLADFIKLIPDAMANNQAIRVSDFVPANEYLDPDRMNPVGESIIRAIRREAEHAGVLAPRLVSVNPPIGFPLEQDVDTGIWYVPTNSQTFYVKDRLRDLGFRWNARGRVWEVARLTADIRREFGLTQTGGATGVRQWFDGWLPSNINRFTRIFSDYARSKQSSYELVFSVANGVVDVSFRRDVNTAAKAVEELRYRYTNKHGREPWLEVMDRFIDLVGATTPNQVHRLIDRINNLQHSNGLFMEHFPSDVRAWYGGFLNAKYHTPTVDELSKQIPDRDLRGLLVEVARYGRRPVDWLYAPTPGYHAMKKELQEVGEQINWRARGYPAYKGTTQVDRFSDEVQDRLNVLRALDTQRERILSTEVATREQEESVVEQARDWSVDHDRAVDALRDALEAQRRRELKDPNHAAAWDAVNFPEEFVARFPYAVPGASSELAQFVARYASLGFAPRRRQNMRV